MVDRIKSFIDSDFRLPLTKTGRRNGWMPDMPDHRDYIFTLKAPVLKSVDLRTSKYQVAIWDQGRLGSCVAQGVNRCFEFDLKKIGLKDFIPSRLFTYYQARYLEGTTRQDAGAMIRDGIKAVVKWGCPPESLCPYIIERFKNAPSKIAYAEASKRRVVRYERVDNTSKNNILNALNLGFPVVFGCALYESFESSATTKTGVVTMPTKKEKPIGGHCMTIVGWDKSRWIVANSWGAKWGDKGYCYMPEAYLTNNNLADDFWVIQTISK